MFRLNVLLMLWISCFVNGADNGIDNNDSVYDQTLRQFDTLAAELETAMDQCHQRRELFKGWNRACGLAPSEIDEQSLFYLRIHHKSQCLDPQRQAQLLILSAQLAALERYSPQLKGSGPKPLFRSRDMKLVAMLMPATSYEMVVTRHHFSTLKQAQQDKLLACEALRGDYDITQTFENVH